ncbi:MAG: HDOD domain-containing protein [Nitrospirae bacterium]|nr:HDOD domain-containing protein [Nitrospirota bacterium]
MRAEYSEGQEAGRIVLQTVETFNGINRTVDSNNHMRDEIKRVVRKLDTLPAIPVAATRLLELFSDEDVDLQDVIALVESDQAIAARLLKTVNSAGMGGAEDVGSVSRAVFKLGIDEVRCTLLGVTVSESLIKPLRNRHTGEQEMHWKHSLACAACAEAIAERVDKSLRAEAFVAGLLHDIGKLILSECFPDEYKRVMSMQTERMLSAQDAENSVLGVDHPTAGKWLLEKWRMPEQLVQTIWLHHQGSDALASLEFVKRKELIDIVRLADMLSHATMADSAAMHSQGADYDETLSALGLDSAAVAEISGSLGGRFSERAAMLDIEDNEMSFYFSALQRANRKLVSMASGLWKQKQMEQENLRLSILHDFHLRLNDIGDADEVMAAAALTLASDFAHTEGMIHYTDLSNLRSGGGFWLPGKAYHTIPAISDSDNALSGAMRSAHVPDPMVAVVEGRNRRFVKVGDEGEGRKTGMVQYQEPFLIIPMSGGADAKGDSWRGELMLAMRPEMYSVARSEVRLLEYLASITAAAITRVIMIERANSAAESLSSVLSNKTRMASELRLSARRYENLFESSNDAIVLHSTDGKIIQTNQRMSELIGRADRIPEGGILTDFLSADVRSVHSIRLRVLWGGSEGGRLETRFHHNGGIPIDVEISSRTVDQNTGLVQSFIRDISDQKRIANELEGQKERLAVTLRSIADGVISTDTGGRITLMNRTAEILTGFTEQEAAGKRLDEVALMIDTINRDPVIEPHRQVLSGGKPMDFGPQLILVSRDGDEHHITMLGTPVRDRQGGTIGVTMVFSDLTEKKQMEEELVRAQKLESLGVLAGGIAHDFNNILTALMGNISIARFSLQKGEDVSRKLEQAEKACSRARDLTQQLLTFAKGGAPVKKTAHIADIIHDTTQFVLRGSNIKCEFSLPADLKPVEVDVGQISQVINNLVINAKHAMPNGGTINISAENTTVSLMSGIPLKPGEYVEIRVADEGCGIPEDHLKRIFDPYFTTKQTGSGLGLASCYSIVSRHQGYITVESDLDIGTTMHIYLPSSNKQMDVSRRRRKKLVTGSGTILIMDDEETIREVAGSMLELMGYTVAFAKDGEEAISMYSTAKSIDRPFDVVIMDLTVPGGMGGREAVARLVEIDPHVKAIVSSGYSSDPVMANYREMGFMGVIAKPYHVDELSETVARVLAGNYN